MPNARPVQPAFYLSQQQIQMLHFLQQSQNITPQQQGVLQQLTHQYKLMQQHQQQLRLQMQQRAAVQAGRPGQPQQFPVQQTGQGTTTNSTATNYQQPGNRTPQSGATAQTGFVNDGNFSPATGQAQQSAGMPYKSASSFPQQQFQPGFTQITSTTNTQELGGKHCATVRLSLLSNASQF